jgi:catechol 2,3-dioxygenase
MAIYRLGHVEVRVPDLDLCAAYYTEVLGLREVERDSTHVYLKGWDERDHHSVILTEPAR